jgi:hypothetical protein
MISEPMVTGALVRRRCAQERRRKSDGRVGARSMARFAELEMRPRMKRLQDLSDENVEAIR